MKKKQGRRRLDQLQTTSLALEQRYLDPVLHEVSWTADACYGVGSYVALLHSEVERTLEELARDSVQRASEYTQNFQVHPILLNATSFFRGEVAARMKHLLDFVPSRASLATDHAALWYTWDSGGARVWYLARVKDNHGAGLNYIASLLHPLGLQIIEKEYNRTSLPRGLVKVGAVSPAEGEELGKFVNLRGAVVHGGFRSALDAFQPHSPTDLRDTSRHALEAVREIGTALVTHW